jgi:hypothetical protein
MSKQSTLSNFFSPKSKPAEEGFLAQLKRQVQDSPEAPGRYKSRTASFARTKPDTNKRRKKQDINPRQAKKARIQ